MEKEKKLNILNLNILRYLKLCIRYWYLFAISILIFGGLALTYSLVKQPMSEVVAQLMLKDDAPSAGILSSQLASGLGLGDMFGSSSTDNETAVLSSHSVFLGAAKDLDLNIKYSERMYPMVWYAAPFTSALKLVPQEGIADTISVSLKFDVVPLDNGNVDILVKWKYKTLVELGNQSLPTKINTIFGEFSLLKTPYFDTTKADKFRIIFSSYNAAAEGYAKIVKIYAPDRKTDFIDLSFVTPDPKFGKLLLNTLIANYIRISNIYRQDRNQQSLNLVNDRLATLMGDLIKSEEDLENFKKENEITNVEADATYLIDKTTTIEGALLEESTKYEVLKLTKDFLSNPENKYSLIPDLGISQVESYNELILQRMSLLNSAKPNNSSVKNLDKQIDALRENVIESVNQLIKNTAVSLEDLKKENNKTKSKIGKIPSIEREFVSLSRDNMLQQQIYLFLLQQREEINMNIATKSLPAQVIDAPHTLVLSGGIKPLVAVFLGSFFGFILAAAYVLFIIMKKSPVSSSSEIKNNLKAPLLYHISAFSSRNPLIAQTDENAAEDIRFLRSEIQTALKACDGNVVAVTSVNSGEGKTTIATNLAASLALTGKRVALVDSNLRTPNVVSLLGLSNSIDYVASYVRGSLTPVKLDTYQVDKYSNLDVACISTPIPNASDIFASDNYSKFVSMLSSEYDYVVIDTSCIKGYSDINYITDIADITLVVCRNGYTSLQDIDFLNELFADGKLKRMAIIENDFKNA